MLRKTKGAAATTRGTKKTPSKKSAEETKTAEAVAEEADYSLMVRGAVGCGWHGVWVTAGGRWGGPRLTSTARVW